MNLLPIIEEFANHIASGDVEIYNEASVQHELAFLLRKRLGGSYKVQLERNVNHFCLENKDNEPFKKKEMDIVVFDHAKEEKHCIELKYPLSGQFPIQMYRACEDIMFLEQLVLSGFDKSYFVMFAEHRPFYSDIGYSGIYKKFRKDKLIEDVVVGTTGAVRDKKLYFRRSYPIEWKTISGRLKYFIVEV
jgi:hypothetical protein